MASIFSKMFAARFLRPSFSTASRSFTTASRSPFNYAPALRSGQPWSRTPWRAGPRVSQTRGYARQAYNYQRWQTSKGLFRRWAARPTFYYEVGGLGGACGVYYIYNLDPVPVSGRRRFRVISDETEANFGNQMYQETLQENQGKILPEYSKEHRQVQRVLNRLIPHSGLEKDAWEIHVIDDDEQKNAFVIPGGKVFVFSGILKVCQGDDGLAAVLGHEIAHNVAHHAAERMSQYVVLLPLGIFAWLAAGVDPGILRLLSSLAFTLPGSRKQEEEADYIGLLMMAESCYDPSAALGLWSRMEQEEKYAPPQFLSTHPSSHNRLGKMRDWLAEAQMKRESSDCHGMVGYADDFRRTVEFPRW